MWNKIYTKGKQYWGNTPSPLVKKFIKEFSPGPALDIGCGDGRNSLFLSLQKFSVEAIDKEPTAIESLHSIIDSKNISNIFPQNIDILDYKFPEQKYNLIIAIHSLQFLQFSETRKIINSIKQSTKPAGGFIMSVFSTQDPAYEKMKNAQHIQEIETNTFFLPNKNSYIHYFTIEEIQQLSSGWDIIHLQNRETRDNHGDLGPHTHNSIDVVLKKLL